MRWKHVNRPLVLEVGRISGKKCDTGPNLLQVGIRIVEDCKSLICGMGSSTEATVGSPSPYAFLDCRHMLVLGRYVRLYSFWVVIYVIDNTGTTARGIEVLRFGVPLDQLCPAGVEMSG